MPDFLKVYGPTLGPLGVPMTDKQAFGLESRLKGLPAEDRAIGLTLPPPPQPAPDLHGQLATLLSALDMAAVTAKSMEEGLASYRVRV